MFENFRDTCNDIYDLDPPHFLTAAELALHSCLKISGVKLELLTNIDTLLIVENGIRGGICQATHRCAKAKKKHVKNYDKIIEPSNLVFLDTKNLYGRAMSQALPVNGFKWVEKEMLSKFNERFIKNYDEYSNKGYFLEVDIKYPKTLFSYKDLPFLSERQKLEKVETLVCCIEDKERYVVHIRALKQALNHSLKLKEVHRVIQFNQEAWLKKCIEMNTRERKKAKNEFENNLFKLMNNSVFGKKMDNVRKHRDIKLVTTEKTKKKISFRTELSYNKILFRKSVGNRNEKDKSNNE